MAIIVLAMPSYALAGTFTWNLSNDFTATAPGANPDTDQYGRTPWSYEQGASSASLPSTFSRLPAFDANIVGGLYAGLSAWSTSSGGVPPLVGINSGGSSIDNGNDTFLPGQIVLDPGSSAAVVAVGWQSPLSQTAQVTINGTLSSDADAGNLLCNYSTTWSVERQDGTLLAGGPGNTMIGAGSSASFAPTVSVAPGERISVIVSPNATSTCDATGLSLQITASGTPPAVTLTSPAPGSSSTVAQPTFSGAAGSDFGDGSQVALSVYKGNTASGTPVATATVARSGASWSATLSSPLPLGTYTARAEQDNVVGDAGLSKTNTFRVVAPVVTLNSPGSVLPTSTPTLAGTAGTEAAEQPFVNVIVYAGSVPTGSPIRVLTTPVDAAGNFSVQISPALGDGTYAAVAAQGDAAGNAGASPPQAFSVDTQAPPVTLLTPGRGSRSNFLQLAFSGAAGTASYDSGVVTVALYKGVKAAGKPFGTLTARVIGSTWTTKWSGALPPARYTAQATQTDAVGHIGSSAAHTFRVVPPPPVIGAVTINGAGRVKLQVACNEPTMDTCVGTVLVLTKGEFAPLPGGPVGRLTIMFAFIRVPGGITATITRKVLPRVAAVVRGRRAVPVTISANLRPFNGKVIRATRRENLQKLR